MDWFSTWDINITMADIDTIREALEELVRIRITETPYPFIRDIHSDNYYQGALKALAALERVEEKMKEIIHDNYR